MTIVLAMGLIAFTSNRLLANDIYITQSGNNFDLDVTQDGNNNSVSLNIQGNDNSLDVYQEGTAGNTVTFVSYWGSLASYGGDINGASNSIKILQRNTTGTDVNRVGMHIQSSSNSIDICQGGTFSSGTDTTCSDSGVGEYGGHTINLDLHSGSNDIRMGQETGTGNADHYAQVYTYGGENNDVFTKQTGNGNKNLYLTIRTDGGEQSLIQRGDGAHTATIDLTGSYHTDLSLEQNSSTNQTYSLTNNCVTVGGCTVSVTQN
jgi:hypothetical protein